MFVVLQRVSQASVKVDQKLISEISQGLLVLLGISELDTEDDIKWICKKVSNLRIFNDDNGIMNKSILDIDGEVIVVSQFTLLASTKKGNRPSYIKAAKPNIAIPIYENFIEQLTLTLGKKVGTGVFGADMKVELLNDGPVTLVIDSKNRQ